MYLNWFLYTHKTRVTQRPYESLVTTAPPTFTHSVVWTDRLQNKLLINNPEWEMFKKKHPSDVGKQTWNGPLYLTPKHHIMFEPNIYRRIQKMAVIMKKSLENWIKINKQCRREKSKAINVKMIDLRAITLKVLALLLSMQVPSDLWQSQAAPEYSEVHTHFPQEQFPWTCP